MTCRPTAYLEINIRHRPTAFSSQLDPWIYFTIIIEDIVYTLYLCIFHVL